MRGDTLSLSRTAMTCITSVVSQRRQTLLDCTSSATSDPLFADLIDTKSIILSSNGCKSESNSQSFAQSLRHLSPPDATLKLLSCTPTQTMDRKSGDIEVEDVYDLAAEIGDQFQKLIDSLGSDSVKHLMPKVIRVLEHLEVVCIVKENFETQMDELKQNLFDLENDKRLRAVSLNKYELEMESLEEHWRKENLHLTQCVTQLRQQNLKLSNTLVQNEKSLSQSLTDLQKKGEMAIDNEIISLKQSIKRSDDKIQSVTRELELKNQEIEKLSTQLEDTIQQNRELRRRVKHNKYQISHWSETIADPNNENSDQTDAQKGFSLAEMRNILLERNYLRTRLKELEEEMNEYKCLQNIPDNSNNWLNESSNDQIEPNSDELVVEGPINREPEDKLFPGRPVNKILRFFPSINWSRIKRP